MHYHSCARSRTRRVVSTFFLGALALCLGMGLQFPDGLHRYYEASNIRQIEEETRTTLMRLSFQFVSLAAATNSTAFPRRSICHVDRDSFYSVIGASPILTLPNSGVELKLVDKTYFGSLLELHRAAKLSPSTPENSNSQERAYWAAFMRCQENSTVYQTNRGSRLEDISEVSSYYFCFHAVGSSLHDSQPVLVEANYTPYNMDTTASEEDPSVTCAKFHDEHIAKRRLGRLRYSIYWSSVETGNRKYHQKHRTYLARDN